MDFKQAQAVAEKANFEERYKMLRSGSVMEKLAAIPYFETSQLIETLKDADSTVRLNALVQINKRDDFYDLARSHADVVALAYDSSPGVRAEVMNIVHNYSGRFSLAKDNGNPACDAAYWEFVRTAEKLAVDPVPEIADTAQKELERHYDRYPWTRPEVQEKEQEQEMPDYTQYIKKDKGMDI